ncbi:YfhO family protein [bacterium]|nr:YfhO family protein [bacterium]
MQNRLTQCVCGINIIRSKWQAIYSRLAKRPLLSSFIIILVSSTIFGLWFKIKQLSVASSKLIYCYPLSWYGISIMQFLLIFCVLWLGLSLISLIIDQKREGIANNLLVCSLPFTAFWLSACNVKLLYPVCLFWIFSTVIIFLKIRRNKKFYDKIKEPLIVLIILASVFLVTFKSLSPLYHTSFFDAWGRIDFFLNFEHQWENAKAYDFIGNFTQQGKLGGYSQGIYMISELSSLIVLLFDIPLVDTLGKYASIKFMFFWLYVFGSYGCYLLLRYGLRLSFSPSFIGGLGFILGNAAFLSFNSTEYSIHQVPFLFLPWVLFLLNRAYSLNKSAIGILSGIGLAGLVASLSEYTLSSHPEINFLYFSFCNSYNIYLAFLLFKRNPFKLKSIPQFFINIAIFPIIHMVSLSYKLIPLFNSLIGREYALYDSNPYAGLPWDSSLVHWSTFFFRIRENVITTRLVSPIANPPIFFFTSQFVMLMIYSAVIIFCLHILSKLFKNRAGCSQNASIGNSFFFLATLLFLGINMAIGTHSWLSELMRFTGRLRVHDFIRMNIFYFFFALVGAMIGLDYMLKLKRLKIVNIVFIVYILNLIFVYFLPSSPKHPEKIYLDICILTGIYLLIYSSIRFKDINLQCLIKLMLISVALLSFFTIDARVTKLVIEKNNKQLKSKDNIYTSFRTAVTYLKNNQHDKASFKYLERKLNKFNQKVEATKKDKTELYLKKIISKETYKETMDYYKKIKNILDKNYTNQLQLFEAIAPEIDNFYMNYGPIQIVIGASPAAWAPLIVDTYNAVQFYLPDKYNLIVNTSGSTQSTLLPVGKNSELSAGLFYGLGPAFPSIDVSFHLKSLYPDLLANRHPGETAYHCWPIELKHLISKNFSDTLGRPKMKDVKKLTPMALKNMPDIKKLLNIYGVDYVMYLKYYLRMSEKEHIGPGALFDVDNLKKMGFIPLRLPESYRFTPRFNEHYEMGVLENTQSYGKAYIARWVKVIKPSENLVNLKKYSYFNKWPLSEDLIYNFSHHMSSIPDNMWRSVLIESSESEDYSDVPYINATDNKVKIVKIIGSKAVFEVECGKDNSWFVYNTAALKGWRAFLGAKEIQIHKANLGFIGVKLNKGKHFLWMEYKPLSSNIGFVVTFLGWILVFLCLIFKLPYVFIQTKTE